MTASWTPGPWTAKKIRAKERGDDFDLWDVIATEEQIDAGKAERPDDLRQGYTFSLLEDPSEANARLFAAAPDLYAALEALTDARPCVLEKDFTAPSLPWLCARHGHRQPCPMPTAQAALKKARGE